MGSWGRWLWNKYSYTQWYGWVCSEIGTGVEEAKAGFKVAVEGLKAAAAVAEFVK